MSAGSDVSFLSVCPCRTLSARVSNNAGTPEHLGELVGREAVAAAVTTVMKPHPVRGWSHHTTHDPIVEVQDDIGTLDTQFIVFNIVSAFQVAGISQTPWRTGSQ